MDVEMVRLQCPVCNRQRDGFLVDGEKFICPKCSPANDYEKALDDWEKLEAERKASVRKEKAKAKEQQKAHEAEQKRARKAMLREERQIRSAERWDAFYAFVDRNFTLGVMLLLAGILGVQIAILVRLPESPPTVRDLVRTKKAGGDMDKILLRSPLSSVEVRGDLSVAQPVEVTGSVKVKEPAAEKEEPK